MRVYQTTNVGLVRRINEDAVLCFDPYTYLVADGMGGHAAGEVASRILVDTIRQTLTVQPAPWGACWRQSAVPDSWRIHDADNKGSLLCGGACCYGQYYTRRG